MSNAKSNNLFGEDRQMTFTVGDTYVFEYPSGHRNTRKLVYIGTHGDMVFESGIATYLTDAVGACSPERWGRVVGHFVPPLVCYAIVGPSGVIVTAYNTLENAQSCVAYYGKNYKLVKMLEEVNA